MEKFILHNQGMMEKVKKPPPREKRRWRMKWRVSPKDGTGV